MELKKYKLGEIVKLHTITISPNSGTIYKLYSLPSFDNGMQCEIVDGNYIQSNKFSVPNKCILFNKLNVRFKRVWRISNVDTNKLCSTEFLPLIVDENIADYQYLYYLLISDGITNYLCGQNTNTSGSHKRIDPNDFLNINVFLPSKSTQKQIGKLLSDIDNKINLNHALNQNLEAMAKQLYDYWFVQFDFPDENGRPYKSSGEKMVWNDKLKREIPKGWEAAKLDNLFQVVADKAKKMDIQHLLYAPIEVLPRKQMSFYDTAPIENAVSGLCKFKKGNILLSNRRVYFHKVCIAPFDGVTRDTVIVLKTLNENTFGFDYQIVNSEHFISYATRFSYGSEQPVFSWQDAKNYYYAKPNNGIAEIYSNCVAPLINKVLEVQNELRELTKQRDELLPLLMNCEILVNSDLAASLMLKIMVIHSNIATGHK